MVAHSAWGGRLPLWHLVNPSPVGAGLQVWHASPSNLPPICQPPPIHNSDPPSPMLAHGAGHLPLPGVEGGSVLQMVNHTQKRFCLPYTPRPPHRPAPTSSSPPMFAPCFFSRLSRVSRNSRSRLFARNSCARFFPLGCGVWMCLRRAVGSSERTQRSYN